MIVVVLEIYFVVLWVVWTRICTWAVRVSVPRLLFQVEVFFFGTRKFFAAASLVILKTKFGVNRAELASCLISWMMSMSLVGKSRQLLSRPWLVCWLVCWVTPLSFFWSSDLSWSAWASGLILWCSSGMDSLSCVMEATPQPWHSLSRVSFQPHQCPGKHCWWGRQCVSPDWFPPRDFSLHGFLLTWSNVVLCVLLMVIPLVFTDWLAALHFLSFCSACSWWSSSSSLTGSPRCAFLGSCSACS